MSLYIAYNGAMPTSAVQAAVTTGTALKTMLQIATPATRGLEVVRWGISFNGSAAAEPIACELIQTDTAATVTAHVAAGVQPYDDPGAPASLMTLSTTGTGYTSTAENTPASVRVADAQLVAPTTGYSWDLPYERTFKVPVSKYLRIRVKAAAAVNAVCFVVWRE